MTQAYDEAVTGLILNLRGGHPEKCDFCQQPYTAERKPSPEEGGEWACTECCGRWEAEEMQKVTPGPEDDAVQTALIKAWHIAKDGCLLPPDGGSPTEGEIAVSARIANRIREMMPDSRLPVLGGDGL